LRIQKSDAWVLLALLNVERRGEVAVLAVSGVQLFAENAVMLLLFIQMNLM